MGILLRMIMLAVEKRDATLSLATLRAGGRVPAVLYGRKETATPISISLKEFEKVFKKAGESSVVTLMGVGEEKDALINEVDVHPVTGLIRHVDFYVLEKGKKVEVTVPLEYTGESGAVKNLGAVLVKVLHELRIEAMPKDLPHSISVDIALLAEIGSQIHVKDLPFPSGVTALVDGEDVIALAAAAKEEEVEPVAPIDLSTIEVEKKGKEDVTEGAEAPAVEAKAKE